MYSPFVLKVSTKQLHKIIINIHIQYNIHYFILMIFWNCPINLNMRRLRSNSFLNEQSSTKLFVCDQDDAWSYLFYILIYFTCTITTVPDVENPELNLHVHVIDFVTIGFLATKNNQLKISEHCLRLWIGGHTLKIFLT